MAATAWNKTIKEIYGRTGRSRSAATLPPPQESPAASPPDKHTPLTRSLGKKTFCRGNRTSCSSGPDVVEMRGNWFCWV